MTKILLHSCCGPCTTYVHKWLLDNNFEVKSLFYNPNIRPEDEYLKRLVAMEQYSNGNQLDVMYGTFSEKDRPPIGECEKCYEVRLTKTAEIAKELGISSFTSTLLVSPYQKHETLKKIAKKIGDAIGVDFFYNDFRPGFRQGQQMARDLKLYRQKYCGCGKNVKAN